MYHERFVQGSSTDYLRRHEAVRGQARRLLRGARPKRFAQHSPPECGLTSNPALARTIINGKARRRVRAGRSGVLVRGITGETGSGPASWRVSWRGDLARETAGYARERAQDAPPHGRPNPD